MVQICASYRPLSQIRCSVWSAKGATSRLLIRLMVAGYLKEKALSCLLLVGLGVLHFQLADPSPPEMRQAA